MASCDPVWDLIETFRQQWKTEHIQQCNSDASQGYQKCAQQQDEGQNQCTQTADEGYNSCSQTADEGYSTCCTWAPCSWFCNALVWVSNIVCVAWTWVSDIVCIAWTWVSDWVCTAWVWVTWVTCRVATWLVSVFILGIEFVGRFFCPIYINFFPNWRICGNVMQQVTSVPRIAATAISFAAVPSRFSYVDGGQRYEFLIDGTGSIVFRPNPSTPPQPVAAQAISFDQKRLGVQAPAPQFDMVAAGCGRVIGKEKGTERLFFAFLDPMFWQFGDSANPEAGIDSPPPVTRASEIIVPSTYFKLDPEENQPGAITSDLLVAVTDPANREPPFNGHPAAVRFNIFKAALAAKSGLIGQLFHGMVVSAQPRLWHLIDARPQEGSGRVPAGIPEYPQVSYCKGGSNTPQVQCSIAFDSVLDIGVGHAHWQEQYETICGGEIQALTSNGLSGVPNLTYYQLFNGPVIDHDAFVDGTCNYYLLCHLATGAAAAGAGACVPLPPDNDSAPPAPMQSFALLFLDEQSLFSQRWRLMHPDDHEGLMFALLPDLHKRPNQWNFDVAQFWCPFKAGNITGQSRMGVSRQVVIVNGVDPTSQRQELYSINFSWATSDYTWRWRAFSEPLVPTFLSESDVQAGTETVDSTKSNLVYPQTIRLREDMTCHVKGTKDLRGPDTGFRPGRWFQKYLPADCLPVPLNTALAAPTSGQPGSKPASGYNHEWQFLPEDTFSRADQFSHFGVYERVDSRSQYYVVDLSDDQVNAAPAGARWEDQTQQLGITRAEFDWNVLSGGGPAALNQIATAFMQGPAALNALIWALPTQTQDFQSFYTPGRVFLRFAKREPIGWIATHWDKRDDDLDVFDGIPMSATLVLGGTGGSGPPAVRLQVTLNRHMIVINVPQVLRASVTLTLQRNIVSKVVVSFQSVIARRLLQAGGDLTGDNLNQVWENIFTVKIGVLPVTGPPLLLFEQDAPAAFTFRTGSDGWFDADWVPADAAEAAAMGQYCSDAGRNAFGTSVWFVDAVGHASTAQLTQFGTTS
jgi:hypothetical protein